MQGPQLSDSVVCSQLLPGAFACALLTPALPVVSHAPGPPGDMNRLCQVPVVIWFQLKCMDEEQNEDKAVHDSLGHTSA